MKVNELTDLDLSQPAPDGWKAERWTRSSGSGGTSGGVCWAMAVGWKLDELTYFDLSQPTPDVRWTVIELVVKLWWQTPISPQPRNQRAGDLRPISFVKKISHHFHASIRMGGNTGSPSIMFFGPETTWSKAKVNVNINTTNERRKQERDFYFYVYVLAVMLA